MIIHTGFVDLDTPTGPMRTHVYAPAPPTGTARYPGLLLYPEIYQQTGPIVRLSQQLAGHGYVVMAPEIYHEHEPPGTVLAYDKAAPTRATPTRRRRRSPRSTTMRPSSSVRSARIQRATGALAP